MSDTRPPTWESLVEVARWAPSPHNTQPWRLAPTDERRADLFMQRSRTLPDEDSTGHFLICAMGIFIEALRIVAAHRGWSLTAAPPPTPAAKAAADSDRLPFATLHLTPGAPAPEHPISALLERRTSRLPTLPRPIPPATIESLLAIARKGDLDLTISADADLIASTLDENVRAVFHDLGVDAYRRELCRWFRPTDRAASRSRDGLAARCFRLSAVEMWTIRRAPRLLRAPVLAPIFRRAYRRRIGACHAMLFLRGPFFESRAAERAGATLLRLWLAMHTAGLTLHPFGNLVTNLPSRRRIESLIGHDQLWLAARIGFTALPPRSERRKTEEILCSDS